MKRTTSILIALAILLSMTGCGIGSLSSGNAVLPTAPATQPAHPSVPTQPKPEETTVPTEPMQTEPIAPAYQIPLTAITMPQIRETDTTETGEAVFTYSYPDVTFLHQDAEVARSVLLNLRNRVEAYRSEAESMKAKAGSIMEATGKAPDHSMSITCDPMRVDQSILSVLLTQELRSDTDMGIASVQAVTYDLVSGKPMTLSQLLAEDAPSDQLQSMLADILSHTDGVYSWYDDILTELFTGNTLPENWYLSGEGLCFYFMTYEIAPYSIEVTVPYHALNGVIRDRYYPPESPEATGTMEVILFEDADLSQFTSFAEVALDDVDGAYLLCPTGTVTQLRIHQVMYDEGIQGYIPTSAVFATDVLTADQAVRLQYVFDGLLSSLQIRYVSGGEEHIRYLLLNGEDGSVFLSE